MKIEKNSLTVRVWIYLILFSLIILVFLWIIQIAFLPYYYEFVKRNDVKDTASQIEKILKSEDNEKELEEISYDSGVCFEIYTDKEVFYKSSYLNKGCLIDKNGSITQELKKEFINSNKKRYSYTIENPVYKNKTIFYGLKVDDNTFVFLNTSLEPIENSISILKSLFVYIAFVIFISSFVIAYFLSKLISKPIIDMNNKAKKLAKGNYDISFKTNDSILEVNELSETLDYVKSELSKIDELRRDLMANVSHDLKTPLTMIKAYSEMARDLNADDKKKREENLNVIIEECDRLNNLVNDILDLSSIQSNIYELNKEKFDLNKLIIEILKRYKYLEEKENYKFIFKKGRKIIIEADKKKLEQVIYNLVNNAIKYTGKDKSVTIKLTKEKNRLKVSVIDTGKGIDKDEIKYIWDKYYKVQKKYERNIVGTGLGLNIVKNILEKHNYEYGVNSEKGKGSEFYFYINL